MSNRKPQGIVEWVNSLSPAQACRLIDAVDPLTLEDRARFDAMSNDDLMKELTS